jgi:hypothetical protein
MWWQTTGMPLGARYGLKRRADAIRLEVASARVKTCMLKKSGELSLRGLNLEECPEEFSWGVPPFEVRTPQSFYQLVCRAYSYLTSGHVFLCHHLRLVSA